MFKEERKNSMLEYINQKKYVKSSFLQKHFNISLMTVNRLLKELHNEGKITKFHGGASAHAIANSNFEPLFEDKYKKNHKAKQKIAEYAVKHFIKNNEIYFFEAGSTAYEMLSFIHDESITIITNGIHIAQFATRNLPSLNMLCSGGSTRPRSMSFVGDYALSFFKNFHANTMFMSCQTISAQGPMDPDPFEIEIKRQMMKHSDTIILLADSSKMNKVSAEAISSFGNIDILISEKNVSPEIKDVLQKNNVELHITP